MKKMYANMHFMYGFCSSNGGAAVVEYWKCYPPCRTFETVYRILRETGLFAHVNADMNNSGVEKAMFWWQCNAYRRLV